MRGCGFEEFKEVQYDGRNCIGIGIPSRIEHISQVIRWSIMIRLQAARAES
jgi:hypothetical protein